ncbi:hypothetical protein ABPG72_004502 [Tetrahymena utriculariae]
MNINQYYQFQIGYDFYSILFFLGGVLFIVLAQIVNSGYKYQDWKIDNVDDSKQSLYISAGINFGLFILCLVWKYLKERQIARQQYLLEKRGFHQQLDEQEQSSSPNFYNNQDESKGIESTFSKNQGIIN